MEGDLPPGWWKSFDRKTGILLYFILLFYRKSLLL
jgi:hypothetical protein